jgi:hypothetical protein
MKTPTIASERTTAKTKEKKDLSVSYNKFKQFEGKVYTGAKVGRHQKWYYDQGEWKEQKVTPDRWSFTYSVTKRRAGKAPEGSGAPVGTEYHWYILAHQTVRKLNANDYTTEMTGAKFKIAHKRADKEKWSASDQAQHKRLVKILHEYADEVESQPLEAKQEAAVVKPRARVKAPAQRAPKPATARASRAQAHSA